MKIELCKDKNEWNKQIISQKSAEFLQSWEWGEFQGAVEKEPLRLIIKGLDKELQLQGFIQKLPLGMKYLYAPRFQISDLGFNAICDWLKSKNFVFVRCEPVQSGIINKKASMRIQNRQPSTTLILDLSKSEDNLLQEMHSKTRYNIKLAQKKGVEIKQHKDAEVFLELNTQTKLRDQFKSHEKIYYKRMLDLPIVYQLNAYSESKPIASNICVVFGDTFTYLHGASSNEDRNLMAPYLLQWEGIKLAKKLNCKYYDFWGIAPWSDGTNQITDNKRIETCFHNLCWQADHKWTGITRFKAGFGGFIKEYPTAEDVILNHLKYKLYSLAKKITK